MSAIWLRILTSSGMIRLLSRKRRKVAAASVAGAKLTGKHGGMKMQPTRIGSFEISLVADYEGPFIDPIDFFPDFDPAVVAENAAQLGPRLIDPATGKLMFSFHSF